MINRIFPFSLIPSKLLQSLKTLYPILVTLLGIVMLVRFLQLSKALVPMLVTPLRMVTSIKLLQLRKALLAFIVDRRDIVPPKFSSFHQARSLYLFGPYVYG